MKKQIDFTIRAHLVRGALIVLPLLAVCVIPFALAQRTYRGRTDGLNGSRIQSRIVMPTCRLLINEGFEDVSNLPGWVLINHSEPLGPNEWVQGNDGVFPAFDGAPNAYADANFYSGGGLATISNWLLTPEVGLQDGDTLTFYTRTVELSAFPDRMQVRMSTNGSSTDVGTTSTDVGDFTNLLLDINPTYAMGGYPEAWTQFTITISGVPAGTSGRIAFRYFVEDGGPLGTRSNYIGLDRVQYCGIPGVREAPTPRPRPTPAIHPTP